MSRATGGYLLEIFRAGTHTAASGAVVKFVEADVRLAAAAYERHGEACPAQLCIGHPPDDRPSYGVVRALRAAVPHLLAYVEPSGALRDMVNTGRFKKVSAAFMTPDAPRNPAPGCYYLKHIGFLGAHPPAVKGLADARFGEGYDTVLFVGNEGHYFDARPLSAAFWNRDIDGQ